MPEASDVILTVGRRKCASARVRMTRGTGKITVNRRAFNDYFTTESIRGFIQQPLVLTSKAGKVMAKIRVFEGVTNDTVALTMGFGHTAFGEFNDGKGMDVMALVTPSSEPGSGLFVWNDTRVNVAQA